jgi:hypothetical protein
MTNIRNMFPKIPAKSKRSYRHRWSLLLTTKTKMEHIFKMGMRTLWVRKCPLNLIGRSSSRRTIIRTSQGMGKDVSPPHHGHHAKTPQLIARFLMNLLYLIQLRIEMDQRYSIKPKNSSPLQVRAFPKGCRTMIKSEKIIRLPNTVIPNRVVKQLILHYFEINPVGNNTLTEMTTWRRMP